MKDEEKELFLARIKASAGSQRGRAALAWMSGDEWSATRMERELGIPRSNAATARAALEKAGLVFSEAIDSTNGREHLFSLVDPGGVSSTTLAHTIKDAEYDGHTVTVKLADGSSYEIKFDGGTSPIVKRKRARKT